MEILTIDEIVRAVDGQLLCGNAKIDISNVFTNSKEAGRGGLFVPIKGERFDAHDFIDEAIKNGASATLTELSDCGSEDSVFIKVKNTKDAFQKLAAYYRSKFRIPIIGVTGSVGKTSTKEMIASALYKYGNVMKTKGNLNSQLGVPMTMFQLDKSHDLAIVEMGISEMGEMSRLAQIVKPDSAVITNIGMSHIENLKTRENILKEKLDIAKFVNISLGKLYLNGDDDIIQRESGKFYDFLESLEQNRDFRRDSVIYYGTNEFCDYRAREIKTVGEGTEFVLECKGYNGKIIIPCIGSHNVYNALSAIAIACDLGLSINDIQEGLLTYKPMDMRQKIYKLGKINIIDDSYNANPNSMKSGIDVLYEVKGKNRGIAVLADMLELGAESPKAHFDVGVYAAKRGIEAVFTVGEESKQIINGVQSTDSSISTFSFSRNEDAYKHLKMFIKDFDNILVKGSRGMHTDEIVKDLLKEFA